MLYGNDSTYESLFAENQSHPDNPDEVTSLVVFHQLSVDDTSSKPAKKPELLL
jgi:hypothetical protein